MDRRRIACSLTAMGLVAGAVACGARTSLGGLVGGEVDAGPSDARSPEEGPSHGCLVPPSAPAPLYAFGARVVGGPSYAMSGDATHLYTFVFAPDTAAKYLVLSIDPCSGAGVEIERPALGRSPLAVAGGDVYYVSYTRGFATIEVVRSDPLGARPRVVAKLDQGLADLTVAGGRGYAVTDTDSTLVALGLDGTPPVVLVGNPSAGTRVGVWPMGVAVDATDAYYVGLDGLDVVPVDGGPAKTLWPDEGAGCDAEGNASRLLLDDDYVYVSGAQGLERVPRRGGAATRYPGTGGCAPVAMDAAYLYFTDASGVHRVAKASGPVTSVAAVSNADFGDVVVTDSAVYWLDYTRAVMWIAKP